MTATDSLNTGESKKFEEFFKTTESF